MDALVVTPTGLLKCENVTRKILNTMICDDEEINMSGCIQRNERIQELGCFSVDEDG